MNKNITGNEIIKQKTLTEWTGKTRQTICKWQQDGLVTPLTIAGIIRWLSDKHTTHNLQSVNSGSSELKDRKLELEIEKLKVQVEKSRENLISVDEVKHQLSTVCANMRAVLQHIGDKYNCTQQIIDAIDKIQEKGDSF